MSDGESPETSGAVDREEARVLLLLQPGTDRELLSEELRRRYDVRQPEGGSLPDAEFDLAVVDRYGQRTFGSALTARKDAAEPVFLPILFLAGSGAPDPLPRELRERVDDIARLPLSRVEFRGRVENLLRSRRLALRARRQSERLEEFAGVVAHDLRSPLNVAAGYIETARETGDVTNLQPAAEAIERATRLVEDVLTVARQGAEGLDAAPTELESVVEAAWAAVDTAGASLRTDTNATVRADPGQLQELLENLVRNSVEHGSTSNRAEPGDSVEHGGADVTVTVGDLPDRDGFFVEDDGPGLPADVDVFERGVSTEPTGTGFGLAIVEEVAALHGWDVDATEAEGGGARFEITNVELVDEA